MRNGMDLKDALKSGATPEKMLEDFQKQLAEAQSELAKEQAATKNLDKARKNMIDSVIQYAIELGVLKQSEAKTAANDLARSVYCVEKEFTMASPLFSKLNKFDTNQSIDNVIRDFVKNL